MKNYTVCIFDKDIRYAKAFIKVVAIEHSGFNVVMRSACGDECVENVDICIGYSREDETWGLCDKAFEPRCGKYAGVSAIMSEIKKFLLDRAIFSGSISARYGGNTQNAEITSLGAGTLLCVHASSGGSGTSCGAIGIARELSRYRGEQVLYLSLEDVEDHGLFPPELRAMSTEEIVYRYLRLLNSSEDKDGFDRLFRSAAVRDEYGLYRLAPDEGVSSLAGFLPNDLYLFLVHISSSLRLDRVVLDFGTRLNFLTEFSGIMKNDEAVFIELCPSAGKRVRKKQTLIKDEKHISAGFPVCHEDIKVKGTFTDICIANAFGLAVKEVCDRVVGFRQ